MNNMEERILIQSNGLRFYQVAAEVGVSESYFSRLLRSEMSPEWKKKIALAVEQLKVERHAR